MMKHDLAVQHPRRRKNDLQNESLNQREGTHDQKALEKMVCQLREANQNLVVATLGAQTMKDELAKAHEKLEARVLERTADLVRANEQLQLEIEERKRMEEALSTSECKLRALARYQEYVKESERKRIAREIHDDLGQNLLTLKIDVSLLHNRTGGTHRKLHERTRASLEHIDGMIKSVKSIINDLRPGALDLGLYAAVSWQVKDFQRRTGIACDLAFEDHNIDAYISSSTATGLFRVVQESLTNILRHAQASQVSISLTRTDDAIILLVIDNGVGIRAGCRRKANSFGLIGMQERILMLGGELAIDSDKQGAGTALRISIPIKNLMSLPYSPLPV